MNMFPDTDSQVTRGYIWLGGMATNDLVVRNQKRMLLSVALCHPS